MSDGAGRWDIVDVDLGRPPAAVPAAPRVAGLQVVFWQDGLALGRSDVPADALPLSAAALAALAARAVAPAVGARLFPGAFPAPLPGTPDDAEPEDDPAALLACERPLAALHALPDAGAAGAAPGADEVSVVVCTRDRPGALARCLASLRASRERPREILVVDNAPASDATREHVATLPDVRYLREPRPGLSAARNAGLRATRGAIVAFTDDDVVVRPDWLERLVRPFADPGVMAVTGLVLPGALESEAERRAEERLWSAHRDFRRRVFDARWFARVRAWGAPVWQVGAGANMAFRRDTFARVGPFDERLGAGAAGCSEDSELWYRVLAAGGTCVYEPAAVVSHFHRDDLEGLRRQWHAYMRGHVTALLVQFARHRHWGNLRRLAFQLPLHYARWLRDVARGDREEGRLWWAAATGAVAGIDYYRRHRGAPPYSTP